MISSIGLRKSLVPIILTTYSCLAQPVQPPDLAPRETAEGVLFQCYAPRAKTVYLAGDFNRFAQNIGGKIPNDQPAMSGPDANGIFYSLVKLAPGLYRYKFVLDGGAEWFVPEYAWKRDSDGNVYLVVDGKPDPGGAVVAHAPEVFTNHVTFALFAPDAHIVYLAGTFNNWANNLEGRVVAHRFAMRGPDDHGIWRTTLPLPPGRHLYQFVVNGSDWIRDPLAREMTQQNQSILVVPK